MKVIPLWACLLIAGNAFAQQSPDTPTSSYDIVAFVAPAPSETYVVKKGEHDNSIARKFGITPNQLRALNPEINWSKLPVGAKINVPSNGKASSTPNKVVAGGTYVVKEGDNDWSIAAKYGISWKQLRALNPNVNWGSLAPGQSVKVPNGAPSPKTVATVKPTKPAVKPVAKPVAKPAPVVITNSGTLPEVKPVSNTISTRGATVIKDDVIVRSRPSTSGSKITQVSRGMKGKILATENGWYKLKLENSQEGWIRADMLKGSDAPRTYMVASASRPSQKASSVVNVAYSYLGTRYVYGGTSRSGIDCSGFTGRVYAAMGIRLPRTAAEQARSGRYVSRGSLRAGDLVFFRTTRGPRISHVGLYIGDGKMIHASSGGGHVRVDSLSKAYYNSRFVTARRLLADTVAFDVRELEQQLQDEDPTGNSEIIITPTDDSNESGRAIPDEIVK